MSAAADGTEGPTVQIGGFTFTVLVAPQTQESKARWDGRAKSLSELLLWLWQMESVARTHQVNSKR